MSQIQPVTETIGEHEYTMYMLPPMESHDLLMDVAKMVGRYLGPVVGALFDRSSQKRAELMEMEIGPEFISRAISGVFHDIDKSALHKIIETFRRVSEVDGRALHQKAIFDQHFAGALDAMYQWILFGARVQWGKSLSALVSGVVGLGAQRVGSSPSPSPSTSNGSSGD